MCLIKNERIKWNCHNVFMGVIEYERRDAYEEGLIQGIILGGKSNGGEREKVKSDICRQISCEADKAEEYMKRYGDESAEKSK